jgi:DNA-binding transcriptional MerR regulator
MTEDRLDFKSMCAHFDVTPRTLRHYEYIELLAPEREGRARFYGPREVARMTLILRGRRFGFSLEEIRQWLELYDADPEGKTQRDVWIAMADRQLDELRARRVELDEIIDELKALRDTTAAAGGRIRAHPQSDATFSLRKRHLHLQHWSPGGTSPVQTTLMCCFRTCHDRP